MSARLTDKQLAELRATWNDCDPMIMALDEIAALKAELLAREPAVETAERLFNRELLHHFVDGEEVDSDDPRNLIQQEVNAMVRAGWRKTFQGWRGDQVLYRFEKGGDNG